MGWFSRLIGFDTYDAAQRVLPDPYEPYMATGGIPVMDPGTPLRALLLGRAQVESFWKSQPDVRKVIDFCARNVASIPLHLYEIGDDDERARVRDHVIARALRTPRPGVGAYRFWHGVLSDFLLYDRWALFVETADDGALVLHQLPSWRLHLRVNAFREVQSVHYWVWGHDNLADLTYDDDRQWVEIPMDQVVFDHGYSPWGAGLSPVDTLRDLLEESRDAVGYRRAVMENGAAIPAYVKRPHEAAAWSEEQRNRFANSLRKYRADGGNAGGWPVFEDGMTVEQLKPLTSVDMNDLEGRRLTAVEVAAAFHIAPELVGARQGNYSNVREYRQTLYRDSLGPIIRSVEDALNAQLVPGRDLGRSLYVEANVESKLRGDFIDQAAILSTSTGAPWLTRNEARAKMNLPAVEGGDELVVPLNVLTGGQASPRDSGTQNRRNEPKAAPAPAPAVKTKPAPGEVEQAERVLVDFFKRQGRVLLGAIGAGEDWWDEERWDTELTDDLLGVYLLIGTAAGRAALAGLSLDPDLYDEARTVAFLREAAARSAQAINDTTFAQVQAAIDDPDSTPADVFDLDKGSRVADAAMTISSFAAGFGTVEAARQQSSGATKTWVVNSSNPRASHAAMDGETVGIDEDFSNGLPWPGAAGSDADEVAGCQCSVVITIP